MFSFFGRKKTNVNPKSQQDSQEANINPKNRHERPEVTEAREYLNKTYPTLSPRDGRWNQPFNYLGTSKNGEYVRYHFCEGCNKRIILVVLSKEEREKVIQQFTEKMKEKVDNYEDQFVYYDSLKGMFIGETVKHRFFSNRSNAVAFMSDDGEIKFPLIPESEDMD